MPIYDAAMKYEAEGRRWSSSPATSTATDRRATGPPKGTVLLGVRAVIAGSFERIHRSNLIGMGVLPLEFAEGESWAPWPDRQGAGDHRRHR
jgi:aconitate hydratase